MFIILLLVGIQPVLGAVYQWRDVSGAMHFTDNPNQVPPQYRKNVVGGLVETVASPTGGGQVKNTARTPVT